MTDKLYSQALNFPSYWKDGVDPRTGQFTYTIPILTVAASRNTARLNLDIRFSPFNNATENCGFGYGWQWRLSSLRGVAGNGTRFLQLSTGQSFRVETKNNEVKVIDQKLLDFKFEKIEDDEYQLTFKSGEIHILSYKVSNDRSTDKAVPVRIYVKTGRRLDLEWMVKDNLPRLKGITDEGTSLVDITYKDTAQPNTVKIDRWINETETRTLTFVLDSSNQLSQALLPSNHATKFNYEIYGTDKLRCITEVTSHTGLLQTLKYDLNLHVNKKNASDSARVWPRVSTHTVSPGAEQPDIVNTYSYSPNNNFLGFSNSGKVAWKDFEDNAYLAKDSSYGYWTEVSNLNDTSQRTRYLYNKWHLQVQIAKSFGGTASKPVTSVIQYFIYGKLKETSFFELQPPSFGLPTSTSTVYNRASPKGSRAEGVSMEWDDWGNQLKVEHKGQTTKTCEYYKGHVSESGCPADPHGFTKHIKVERTRPHDESMPATTPVRRVSHRYKKMSTATGTNCPAKVFIAPETSETRYYPKGDDSAQQNNYKTLAKAFSIYSDGASEPFDIGRLQQHSVRMIHTKESRTSQASSAVFAPLPTAEYEVVQSYDYGYDNGEMTMETTTKSQWDGKTRTISSTKNMFSGFLISETKASKVRTEYEYNELGKLKKVTTAAGTKYAATRKYDYTFLNGDGYKYQVVETPPAGGRKKTTMDGLGRKIAVEMEDADDDSVDNYEWFEVEVNKYDALGRLSSRQSKDRYKTTDNTYHNMETTETHNYLTSGRNWGEVASISNDSTPKKKKLMTVDLVDLTIKSQLEGEGWTIMKCNDSGKPLQILSQFSGSTKKTEVLHKALYDPWGRVRSQISPNGAETLYDYDEWDRPSKVTLNDGKEPHTITTSSYMEHTKASLVAKLNIQHGSASEAVDYGTQSFDGLNRKIEVSVGGRTSKFEYPDGESNIASPITLPGNRSLNLIPIPELGDQCIHQGEVTKNGQSSGLKQSFDYHPLTGKVSKSTDSNSQSTRILEYYNSGKVKSEIIDNNKTIYTWSLKGKLVTRQDPDGSVQRLQYYNNGRLKAMIEGSYAGNAFVEGPLSTTYEYDDCGRLSLITTSLKQGPNIPQESIIQIQIDYDGLGREKQRILSHGGKKQWTLQTEYLHHQIHKSIYIDHVKSNQKRTETFWHDKRGRLERYAVDGQLPGYKDTENRDITGQAFTYDHFDNIKGCKTTFKTGSPAIATYYYTEKSDPTRLTKVSFVNPNRDETYEYNGAGQIKGIRVSTSGEEKVLEYDDYGRQVKSSSARSNYSIASGYHVKQLRIETSAGEETQFGYDLSSGRLVTETSSKKSTRYIRASNICVATVSQKGAKKEYKLVATDQKGSILTTFDAGTTTNSKTEYCYTPFGLRSRSGGNEDIRIGFNGELLNLVTGDYILGGFRAYSPLLGRFRSPDATSLSPFGKGGLNPYAYCHNDPVNLTDSSGHVPSWLRGVFMLVATVAVGAAAMGLAALAGPMALPAAVGMAALYGFVGGIVTAGAGAAFDLVTGGKPSWKHAGTDFIMGFLSAAGGALASGAGEAADVAATEALAAPRVVTPGMRAGMTVEEELAAIDSRYAGLSRYVDEEAAENYSVMVNNQPKNELWRYELPLDPKHPINQVREYVGEEEFWAHRMDVHYLDARMKEILAAQREAELANELMPTRLERIQDMAHGAGEYVGNTLSAAWGIGSNFASGFFGSFL